MEKRTIEKNYLFGLFKKKENYYKFDSVKEFNDFKDLEYGDYCMLNNVKIIRKSEEILRGWYLNIDTTYNFVIGDSTGNIDVGACNGKTSIQRSPDTWKNILSSKEGDNLEEIIFRRVCDGWNVILSLKNKLQYA